MSYCSVINYMADDKKAIHKPYHDDHYGFPIHDDNELFGRLIMEINQAVPPTISILQRSPSDNVV
jgi:DNA-3-methyladenine glycosylase I